MTDHPSHRALLVSIHDVTPAWEGAVRALWALCVAAGVRPALLVVPQWHGGWALEDHPAFVRWVAGRAAEGVELFLHGERHDETGLPRGWRDSVRALGRTAREGEFLTLDLAAATRRIARGAARLRALGLQPIGFVPPAWLAREDTFQAVEREGLLLSEDVRQVRVHGPAARRIPAPVVRWSGRGAFRAWASAGVAAWHDRREGTRPVVRMALHPMDLAHPATRRSLERTLARWSATRVAVPYRSLLAADPTAPCRLAAGTAASSEAPAGPGRG